VERASADAAVAGGAAVGTLVPAGLERRVVVADAGVRVDARGFGVEARVAMRSYCPRRMARRASRVGVAAIRISRPMIGVSMIDAKK